MSFDYIREKYTQVALSLASSSRSIDERLSDAWEPLNRLGVGGEREPFPNDDLQKRHDRLLDQLHQKTWKDEWEARRLIEEIFAIQWILCRIEGARDADEYAAELEKIGP